MPYWLHWIFYIYFAQATLKYIITLVQFFTASPLAVIIILTQSFFSQKEKLQFRIHGSQIFKPFIDNTFPKEVDSSTQSVQCECFLKIKNEPIKRSKQKIHEAFSILVICVFIVYIPKGILTNFHLNLWIQLQLKRNKIQ